MRTIPCGALAATILAPLAWAGAPAASLLSRDVPDFDRWNYPFNATPGVSETAPTFSAVGTPFLDNMDSQFLISFETAAASPDGVGVIPAGLGPSSYQIVSAQLRATIATGGVFAFDSTFDAFTTFLDPMDPDFTSDADTGRPLMLFGTGYRNGFGLAPGDLPYTETTAFTTSPAVPTAPRVRSAFPTDFFAGVARDVSNVVTDRFDPVPLAIGQIVTSAGTPVAEGALVPAEATVIFDLDVMNPDVTAYLQAGLDAGTLRLSATSLTFATGGPGGGGGVTYPVYFTKEDPLAALFGQTARLTLEYVLLTGSSPDLDDDGVVGASDLAILLAAWGGTGPADLDRDGTVGASDLAILLAAWG